MARKAATIDIGINVPASEINKAERQINSLFHSTQSFNKNPINSKAFTQPLGRITGAANEFNKSLEASNARVIAFGASAGAIFAVQRALEALVKTTITVEQKLTNIQALLGSTGKEFQRLSDGLYKAAQATGMTFDQTAESMEEFARQGLNTAKSLERTTAAMTLAKLGGMDVKNATESLTAAMNTFGDTAGSVTQVVNKLAQVDAKFAVSSGDLAEAIKRSGSAAVSANVSFEQFISAVTVAQERTARGGAVIGNSFKTIFTRIQRPETLRQLKDLGVAIKDNNQEMLPAMTILKNYAKVYDNLAPSLRATSAEMLAGVFQVNVLKSVLPELASETGKFDQALKVANQTTNEASERMKFLTSTTEGTLNKTMVNLTKFASEVGNLTIKPALDRMLSLLNGFADLISPRDFLGLGETVGTAVYKGMGKIIEGPGLVLLGVVLAKIGAKLAGFVRDISSGFIGIQSSSEKLANTQNIITNILAERPKLIQQATASEEGMVAVARVLAQKIKESRREMELLTSAAQKAAPAVLAMQGGAKATGGKGKGGKKAGGFVPTFNLTPSQMAAGGFVPNYDEGAMERRLAAAGGYQAGKIRQATLPGVGQVTFNGNEKIKSMPGLEQPAIMPPSLSSAGRNYRDAFQKMHGYDPYNSASGFIPNFNYINPRNPSETLSAKTFARRMNLDKSHPNHITAEDATAAQYTPSKATAWKNKGGKKGTADRRRESGGDSVITHAYDAAGRVGILSMFGGKTGRLAEQKQAYLDVSEIPAMKELIKKAPELANDRILFDNVQVAGVQRLADRADDKEGKNFSKFIGEAMAEPLAGLASEFGKTYLGNELSAKSKKDLSSTLKKAGSYLNPGTEGDLFEMAVRALVTKSSELKNSFDANRSFKQPFDFEETGVASPNLIEMWGFKSSLIKADAKRSATQDQVNSVVKKSYNQAILHEEDLGAMFSQNLPGLAKPRKGSEQTMRGSYLSPTQRQRAKEKLEKSLASGFVPNFAASGSRQGAQQAAARVGAVSDAINREDRAGVRRDKVRVGMDKRLRGGIGVYNTDEGSLSNAINMHLASGANMKSIQTMGKAFGYIPNFAKKGSSPAGGGMQSMGLAMGGMLIGGQISAFGDELEKSESSLTSFSGSILSVGGQLAMWIPTLSMVAESLGGMSNISKKVKENFSKVSDVFSKGRGALNRLPGGGGSFRESVTSTGGLSNPFMTDRAGRGTSRTLAGGRRRRRSLAEMVAGRTSGGNERVSRGSSLMDATRERGRRMRAGAGRGFRAAGGALRGGAGALGSSVGLSGGAAVAGGAALGVGALALGGVKLYQMHQEKKRQKMMAETEAMANKQADSFKRLGDALSKLRGLTDEYSEAVESGNVGEQRRIRKEMVTEAAIGTEDSQAFSQFLKSRGGSVAVGGTQVSNRNDLLSAIADPSTSVSGIRETLNEIEGFKAIMDKQQAAMSGITAGYKEFSDQQNQTPLLNLMGVGGSKDLTPDQQNKMASSYADLIGPLSPEIAQKMMLAFQELTLKAHDLNIETVTTEGEMHGFNNEMADAMGKLGLTSTQIEVLRKTMKAAADTTGSNEADMGRLNIVIATKVTERLRTLARRAGHFAKINEKAEKPMIKLIDAVSGFRKTVLDAENAFKLDKGINEMMEKEIVGMFDVTTKSLQDTLSQTASKISQIQVSNEISRNKIDLDQQNLTNKRLRESSEAIFKTIKETLPNVTQRSQDEVGGFTTEQFQKQISGPGGLGDALLKAASAGAFSSVDEALAKAIQNTSAGFAPGGGATESDTIQQNMIKLREATDQQIKALEIQITLDKKSVASQKRLIDAQEEAAIQQQKLAQRIAFMGGISGGSGNPEKFTRDFASAQLLRSQGGFTGSRDEKTQGLLNVAKTLNSLNIGKSAFNEQALAPLYKQIGDNITSVLAGMGMNMSEEENKQMVSKIAKTQIDNLIKPDKTLGDLETSLLGQTGLGKLNSIITENALQVKVMNPADIALAENNIRKEAATKQANDQSLRLAKFLSAQGSGLAGQNAADLSKSFLSNEKQAGFSVEGGILSSRSNTMLQQANSRGQQIKTAESRLGKAQQRLKTQQAPGGLLEPKTYDFDGYYMDTKDALMVRDMKNAGIEAEHQFNPYHMRAAQAKWDAKYMDPNSRDYLKPGETMPNNPRPMGPQELLARYDAKVAASPEGKAVTAAQASLKSARGMGGVGAVIERDRAAKAKAKKDEEREERERATRDKARRANTRREGIFNKGVAGVVRRGMAPQAPMGSIAQEMQAIRIQRGNDGVGVRQENNSIARQSARDFYNKNKDIPNFFNDFEGDIERLGEAFEDASAAEGFETAIKQFKEGLMDLQQRVDWQGLDSGMRTVEQATQNTREQIRARIAEGKSITSLLANLKNLQKEREKNTKATGAETDALDFFDAATEASMSLNTEMRQLGLTEQQAAAATEEVDALIKEKITDENTHAEQLEKLAKIQEKYNLILNKTRESMGLLTRDEVKKGMIDAFTNQTQKTAQQVEGALNNMIGIISGADYYGTAEASAMRAKQINSKLANDLINELDGEVSAIEGRRQGNARQRIRSGEDPKTVMNDLNAVFEENAFIMAGVGMNFYTLNDALYMMSRNAEEAELKLQNLNVQTAKLGSFDPREVNAANVKGAERAAMAGGNDPAAFAQKRKELLGKLGGKGLTTERKQDIAAGLVNSGIFKAIGDMSAQMISGNLAQAVEAQRAGLNGTKEFLALDETRQEIIKKLKNETISMAEAEIKLGEARAKLRVSTLNKQLADGTISEEEYKKGIADTTAALDAGGQAGKNFSMTLGNEIGALFAIEPGSNWKRLRAGIIDIFKTLKEGTKGALKEVITGTSSMREAFLKVFQSIGDKMLDNTISMFVDNLFAVGTSFLRRNEGGVVGYNGGGVVQGGSGVRDDVPALLTKGEYVVRKSAVNKYGSGFIEKINRGEIRQYADGGAASFNLANQYDYLGNQKRPTGGAMNVDSKMSAFAQTDTNNPMNQLKFDRESTLDSYLKEKAQYEEQKRQAMAAYKKQRKGVIKSALIQIAMAGATMGLESLMAGAGSVAGGAKAPKGGAKGSVTTKGADGASMSFESMKAAKKYYNGQPFDFAKAKSGPGSFFSPQKFKFGTKNKGGFGGGFSSPKTGAGIGGGVPPDPNVFKGLFNKGGTVNRGGGTDNIPALLTGGEYVINKRSVDRYGLGFMDNLNKGNLPGFNRGGLVGVGDNGSGTPLATGTGGAPSNVNNNITINVTVENDGTVNADTSNEQSGGNQNTQGALQEEERNKQFGGAIKDAVVREIVEQKRPGGLLYNEQRTSA